MSGLLQVLIIPQFSPNVSRTDRINGQCYGPHNAGSGRRYYSPSQGRFLGRDPIEEQGGLHLYGFCGNNGVNRWDLLGMNVLDADGSGYDDDFIKGLNKELWWKQPDNRDLNSSGANGHYMAQGNQTATRTDWNKYINIGKTYENRNNTNALKFDGSKGSSLIVYSHKELGELGGNRTIQGLPDGNPNVRVINIDLIPAGSDVNKYITDLLGDQKFSNIVYARHGDYDGTGNQSVISQFDANSSLNSALSSHASDGASIWLNSCFGASYTAANPDYLSGISQTFGGASVYYSSGLTSINTSGLDQVAWAGLSSSQTYVGQVNANLDYQVYRPPTK